MRRGAIPRVSGLLALLACMGCGIFGSDEGDPCFKGDKTDEVPDDDVRIGILNQSGTSGLIAVFTGPGGQRQECAVREDVAEPTNVVFRMNVGQSMTLDVSGPLVSSVRATCVLHESAYATPDFGTPGNAFISIDMGGTSTAFCGQGFEFGSFGGTGPE